MYDFVSTYIMSANEDDLKNEDNLKNEDYLTNEDNLKMKTTPKFACTTPKRFPPPT